MPRRWQGGAALALLGSGLVLGASAVHPRPSAAAGEAEVVRLPGETAAAVTADLDGDGARELLRIVAPQVDRPDVAIDMVIEAWAQDDGGAWAAIGSVPILRRTDAGFVSVDALTDAYGLLRWSDGARERVMLATGQGAANRGGGGGLGVCCVELLDVTLSAEGVELSPLHSLASGADTIVVLDMDDDGIDELVAEGSEGPDAVPRREFQRRFATVLQWTGSAFSESRLEIGISDFTGSQVSVGESDGIAGEEAIYGPMGDGSLARVSLGADGVAQSQASSWGSADGFAWIGGVGGGMLYGQMPNMLTTWRWERGEEPELTSRVRMSNSSSATLLVAGDEAVVVETEHDPGGTTRPVTRVWAPTGRESSFELPPSEVAYQLLRLNQGSLNRLSVVGFGAYPYSGPIPTATDTVSAHLSMGNLITLDQDGEIDVVAAGTMAGVYPVGLAGRDDGWLAMGRGYVGDARRVYLFASSGFGQAEVLLAPADAVLDPEPASPDPILAPDLPAGDWSGGRRQFVTADGLTVDVRGPAGSLALGVIDEELTFQEVLEGAAATIRLEGRRNRTRNAAHDAAVAVITPLGHAFVEAWELAILHDPPEITATAFTRLGEFSATVSGSASIHAAVIVDGQPIALDEDGSFETTVGAPIWPRDIRVVARDPVGTEAVAVVSAVGGFDYRGLPWAIIVAAATAVLAVTLFLRTPRHAVGAPADDGGGRLEELDGDVPAVR